MIDLHELNDDIAPVTVEPIPEETNQENIRRKPLGSDSRNQFKSQLNGPLVSLQSNTKVATRKSSKNLTLNKLSR